MRRRWGGSGAVGSVLGDEEANGGIRRVSRYAAAAGCTSSAVALRMRSRLMKSRRQSPAAAHDGARPTWSDWLRDRSMDLRISARARSTSSLVRGWAVRPSRMPVIRVRASSNEASLRTIAVYSRNPGSRRTARAAKYGGCLLGFHQRLIQSAGGRAGEHGGGHRQQRRVGVCAGRNLVEHADLRMSPTRRSTTERSPS